MGINGSPSWLLLRGLMLHTGKTREENFREEGVVLYIKGVSACIRIEALRGSVSQFSTFGSMRKHLQTAVMKRLRLSSSYGQ